MNSSDVHHFQTRTEIASQEAVREGLQWVPRIGLAFLILLGFWIAAAVGVRVIQRMAHRTKGSKQVVLHLAMQITKFSLIAFGIVTALGTVGVNISPIVAGLGLTGFAVGFALRDILSNLVSGTLILFFQPFQVKDYLAITGFEGAVVNIELRYTVLLKDGRYILIPNSFIFTNPVVITPAKAPDVDIPTQFL